LAVVAHGLGKHKNWVIRNAPKSHPNWEPSQNLHKIETEEETEKKVQRSQISPKDLSMTDEKVREMFGRSHDPGAEKIAVFLGQPGFPEGGLTWVGGPPARDLRGSENETQLATQR